MAAQLEVYENANWIFRVRNDNQILALKDLEKWEKQLQLNAGDTLPEAIFGNNFMQMTYKGSPMSSITHTLKWHALYILQGALYRNEPNDEEISSTVNRTYSKTNAQSEYEVHLKGDLRRNIDPVIKPHGAVVMPLKRINDDSKNQSTLWELTVPLIVNNKIWQKKAMDDCKTRGIQVQRLNPALDWTFTSLSAINIISGGNIIDEALTGACCLPMLGQVNKYNLNLKDAGYWGMNDREQPYPHMKSTKNSDKENTSKGVEIKALPGGSLPLLTLSNQELPIRFHTTVELFRDDLNDCGHARCVAMIRVMDDFWFAKLRTTMHVDNVICRVVECRLFCWHDKPSQVHMEWSLKEASLVDSSIKQKISPLIQQGNTRVESFQLYVDTTTPKFANFSIIMLDPDKGYKEAITDQYGTPNIDNICV